MRPEDLPYLDAAARSLLRFTCRFIGSVVVLVALQCCENLLRSFPTNFILLFVFTIFESVFLSAICLFYKRDEVMMAAGITAIDFTVYTGVAFVFLILLMIFGLVAMLFPTRYILIDTQLIMGGESRACQISPEDYITGALMLYLDIMNLFVYILQILRQLNGDD
ncbi:hypothetical protein HPB49_018785 [Dermacentor silvarum]|uniref:Uncharacterized protein n=1 Tax=Dermacentor silvarum TaxID=543639 RepID=A0ACB8DQA8_DERSI|nr:hypothetical protein HPB49_018785 [Dermacentor silvarum]